MSKKLIVSLFFILMPPALFAQTPKAEIFAGYSFVRAGDLNASKGWNGSLTGNMTQWFGLVADFDGHYYHEDVVVPTGLANPAFMTVNADASLYAVRGGPKFTFRGGDESKVNPFAQVLVGMARTQVKGSASALGTNVSVSHSSSGFAVAAGGGIDIVASKSIAIRAIQAEYNRFNAFDGYSQGVRLSTGIVFRF